MFPPASHPIQGQRENNNNNGNYHADSKATKCVAQNLFCIIKNKKL
jgi:hypothetical protein